MFQTSQFTSHCLGTAQTDPFLDASDAYLETEDSTGCTSCLLRSRNGVKMRGADSPIPAEVTGDHFLLFHFLSYVLYSSLPMIWPQVCDPRS